MNFVERQIILWNIMAAGKSQKKKLNTCLQEINDAALVWDAKTIVEGCGNQQKLSMSDVKIAEVSLPVSPGGLDHSTVVTISSTPSRVRDDFPVTLQQWKGTSRKVASSILDEVIEFFPMYLTFPAALWPWG
jgi:hypothetical protein